MIASFAFAGMEFYLGSRGGHTLDRYYDAHPEEAPVRNELWQDLT
jgi:hypothetical protein